MIGLVSRDLREIRNPDKRAKAITAARIVDTGNSGTPLTDEDVPLREKAALKGPW